MQFKFALTNPTQRAKKIQVFTQSVNETIKSCLEKTLNDREKKVAKP